MTAEEVEEYINQITFSGATDFIEKYKDKSNADQIIGHFGLGFYSAFMVADEVHIDTLSYKEGAKAVHWECDGGTQFSMEDGDRTEVGTTITLFLNEDCLEFCNEYRAREVVKKYCSFMPTEIYLSKANTTETQTIQASEKLEDDVVIEEIQPEKKESEEGAEAEEDKEPEEPKLKIRKRPELINETTPLWTKHPNECNREEYLEFYRKVFQDYKEPLFWIHLNMDYPFNLKGILYFPKINMEYESIEGTIKLYNNQVFIADNIKEVIPEFLLLLKGRQGQVLAVQILEQDIVVHLLAELVILQTAKLDERTDVIPVLVILLLLSLAHTRRTPRARRRRRLSITSPTNSSRASISICSRPPRWTP